MMLPTAAAAPSRRHRGRSLAASAAAMLAIWGCLLLIGDDGGDAADWEGVGVAVGRRFLSGGRNNWTALSEEAMKSGKGIGDAIVSKYRTTTGEGENIRPVMRTFFDVAWTDDKVGGNAHGDYDLLNAWAEAWHDAGWEPRVLSMRDAKQHPDFDKYDKFLNHEYKFGRYNALCFWRWFAMATVEGGGWMVDHDVFPLSGGRIGDGGTVEKDTKETQRSHSFVDEVGDNLPNGGELTIHEYFIPCMISGSQSEWDRVARLVIDNAVKRFREKGPGEFYSDMLSARDLQRVAGWRNQEKPFRSTVRAIMGKDFISEEPFEWGEDGKCVRYEKDRAIAVHFSHESMFLAMKKGLLPKDTPGDAKNRPEIIKEWMGRWNRVCNSEAERGINKDEREGKEKKEVEDNAASVSAKAM